MVKRRLIPDVTILMQLPDTPAVRRRTGYFTGRHDMMTDDTDRIFKITFTPYIVKGRIQADMDRTDPWI
jgi:hypothetical protein